MTPEQKIKKNEKARKMKFLEDYFSLCREHGFCIDDRNYSLVVEDWPTYIYPPGEFGYWEDIKKELRESI